MRMKKVTTLIAAACFAVTPLFATGQGDTVGQGQEGKEFRMACTVPFRTLNLTDDQRKKMSALMAEHHKEGCTPATETKFFEGAKGILTPEQFAKFKASYEQGPKMKM